MTQWSATAMGMPARRTWEKRRERVLLLPWASATASHLRLGRAQVLDGRIFETVFALQQAIELVFRQRVVQAKKRHDRAAQEFLAATRQNSRYVL